MALTEIKSTLTHLSERLGRAAWKRMPERVLSTRLMRACGARIHDAVSRANRLSGGYCPCTFTRFFRNVPLLEVLRDLVAGDVWRRRFSVVSLGCSTGAELYSLLWHLHEARPELAITARGVDLSAVALERARAGNFSRASEELSWLSEQQIAAIFDERDGVHAVRRFPNHDIDWLVGDVLDPALPGRLGCADLVMANNFLGAFQEEVVEQCLDNIARLVKPDGLLVVFGMDLDMKTRWMQRRGYAPVNRRIEDVHLGDRIMLDWPWTRWGMEPVDKTRDDWQARYAAIFRVPSSTTVQGTS